MPTEEEYSHLRIESIQSLEDADPGSLDGILFKSSGGRWKASLTGAIVALQRISLSPKLHVVNEAGQPILAARSLHRLGDGNRLDLLPTYWTPENAPPGTYSAIFKLVDLRHEGARLADSGRFTFDFRVARRGDIDGDNDVDADDLFLLINALGTASNGPADSRDLTGDGLIDHEDLKIVVDTLGAQR
jgi:hypothetical protein